MSQKDKRLRWAGKGGSSQITEAPADHQTDLEHFSKCHAKPLENSRKGG